MTDKPGRGWALAVLVLAGLISVSFNTVHAFESTRLPWPLAVLYGVGPVLLAALQSHTVALNVTRAEPIGRFRLALTFGLVVGGLGLSFLGVYDLVQHAVPDPIPATPINEPAVFFPVTIDLMALAALHELLRVPAAVGAPVEAPAPASAPEVHPAALAAPGAPESTLPAVPEAVAQDVHTVMEAEAFAADLAAGRVPSIRAIRAYLGCGQVRAKRAHEHVRAALAT